VEGICLKSGLQVSTRFPAPVPAGISAPTAILSGEEAQPEGYHKPHPATRSIPVLAFHCPYPVDTGLGTESLCLDYELRLLTGNPIAKERHLEPEATALFLNQIAAHQALEIAKGRCRISLHLPNK
jgi:hypothetical protein